MLIPESVKIAEDLVIEKEIHIFVDIAALYLIKKKIITAIS